MKISIVTVSHNSAATIGDTLASVAEQTHQELEHLVVDGASSDGTQEVVRRRGSHVAKLLSEPDHGVYDAMNKGLSLADGEVVGFLNADDLFADCDAVARIATAFAGPSKPDIVFGDLVYVSNRDTTTVVRHWRSGEYRFDRLKFGWMPPHPTFYIRRSLLEAIDGFDTSMRVAADYEFMLRCLTRPDVCVAYLPSVLVRMRLGGISNASMSSIFIKSREDLEVIRRHRIGNWMTLACKNVRKLPQFLKP